MKITIELNENEVKALKAYLKEVSHDIDPKITKKDIEEEIRGAVNSHLQCGSLGDYYEQFSSPDIDRSITSYGNNDDC